MKTLVTGHRYELANFENPEKDGQIISFIIHKELKAKHENNGGLPLPGQSNELVTISDGTTNEEVLAVLIDRLTFLNSKFPCRENSVAITHIETALMWLEKRTKDRIKRGVEGQHKA